MGQTFGNLTHSAVVSPDGTIQWQASPAQAGQTAAKEAAQTAQPSTADVGANGPTFDNPQPKQPQIAKPSFLQASTNPQTGTPNVESPGLTKMGKLALILTQGAKGALAGRAAQEQMIAQTGGRRAGGFGTGFQGGMAQPYQEAEQRQQAALGQAGLQPIPLPGGVTVPAAIAPKFLSPYYGYQGKVQSAQIGAGAKEQAAQTEAGARTQAAQIGGNARVQAAQLELGPMASVPSDLQQQYGLPAQLPLKMLNQAESAANRPLTTVAGANDTYVVNKQTNQKTPLGVGSPRLAAINQGVMEVADPDRPGETKVVRKGQAADQGLAGAQSASVQVPRKAALAEVPTNVGNQKVAFTTAIQHADLLRRAARALNNGDVQALNGLENAFSNAFGSTGPVTAKVIGDAYTHEAQKMLSGGHVTEGDLNNVGKSIDPSKQNYAQIDSVLSAYQALAQSKMNMLNQQSQNAVKASQPAKKGAAATPSDPFAAFGGRQR